MLVTAILILIAFPILTAAMVLLFADRHFGTHIYTTAGGGVPVLYQNLFWFFGHPEVYILALPYFGIVTDDHPRLLQEAAVRLQGHGVRHHGDRGAVHRGVGPPHVHHGRGPPPLLLPAVAPHRRAHGHQVLQLDRDHVARPDLVSTTPMLFCIGFLFAFLMGGLTGIMLASPPIDFATHDTYFVVAHFHQVLFGTAVFAGFAGFYYWYPKFFGRMYARTLGKWHFWLHVHRLLGDVHAPVPCWAWRGMPRRVASYDRRPRMAVPERAVDDRCLSSSASRSSSCSSTCWVSWRKPVPAGDNPWDGHTLEWFATSPPVHHNFERLPPVRSERPVWDYHHPDAMASPTRTATVRHRPTGRRRYGTRRRTRVAKETRVRIEALFLLGIAVFFGIVGVIYWFWAYEQGGNDDARWEPPLLGFVPGSYYLWWSRRMKPRPEDRTDASVEDGGGVIGSFPTSSIWPFVLGMGLFLIVLSLVFGIWLLAPGFALVISAGVGVTVESRRGGTV